MHNPSYTEFENSGEIRALRALMKCANEGRNSFHISSMTPNIISILLANAEHASFRIRKKTTDSFPDFKEDLSAFSSEDNLKNLLMAEQIWLESNQDEMQAYAYALLQKLDRENYGQSQTPRGLREVVYQVVKSLNLESKPELSVLDPACGYGVLLSGLPKLLAGSSVKIYGQDINPQTKVTANRLFQISGLEAEIRYANLLETDAFPKQSFDLVLLDAPVGLKWDRHQINVEDPRFNLGLPPVNDASLLFIQAALAKLKPVSEGGGFLIALTTNRNLVGEALRREIIEGFVAQDLVHTVIALPSGLIGFTQLPLYLVVLTNRKEANWENKTQLVDVKAEFEEVPGLGDRRRRLSRHGLEQIGLAISKPKSLKTVRTLSAESLWLQKCEVSYKDCAASVWAKNDQETSAQFSISSQLVGVSESTVISSDVAGGLGSVDISFKESYVSYQVEPRFTSTGRAVTALDHTSSNNVSLMRFASKVLCLSKANSEKFNEFSEDFLAIPRSGSGDCLQVKAGDAPNDLTKFIFLGLHDDARIASVCIWLNTQQGRSAREEAWKQINSREKFMAGILSNNEVIEFLAYLQVPYLEHDQLNHLVMAESLIEQSITILNNLRDEIWIDEEAISTVKEVTGALNSSETLGAWAEQLPFPLAASLRTYETFALDEGKAAEQLIHFWEATAAFHATYLLSALYQSEELWNSEIPKLRLALEGGKCGFERATIGTWRITIEYLSSRFLSLMNSDDIATQDRIGNLLGGSSKRTHERLLSPKIAQLIGQVNVIRNTFSAHSGTMSFEQDRVKKESLLGLTNELRSELGHAWSGFRLVRPGAHYILEEGTIVDCEILMGPTTPFKPEKLSVNENLRTGALYLVSQSGSLKLAPLIQMNAAPSEVKNTCYFYSRTDADGARLVSYQLATQNEWKDETNQLQAIISEMQSLTVSPLEEL